MDSQNLLEAKTKSIVYDAAIILTESFAVVAHLVNGSYLAAGENAAFLEGKAEHRSRLPVSGAEQADATEYAYKQPFMSGFVVDNSRITLKAHFVVKYFCRQTLLLSNKWSNYRVRDRRSCRHHGTGASPGQYARIAGQFEPPYLD